MARIAHNGMKDVDREILEIMLAKKEQRDCRER